MSTAEYLAGVFDGEGCVYSPPAKSRGPKRITIVNVEPSIIDTCTKVLDDLDIDYRVYVRDYTNHYQTAYTITITSRDNLVMFRDLVPFHSHPKRKKLDALLASYKRARPRVRRT